MSSTPGRAAPLPPDERRAAVITAAIPLVCDHGAAVTTREIAEAAGIAEGTIFRVFPDKDALIGAVVTAVLDPAPLVAELRRIDALDSLERVLAQAVDALRRRIANVSQIMWMLRDLSPARPGGPPGPDLTELNTALADLLLPHRHELRVPPAQAARLFRIVGLAGAHPRLTDGDPLPTAEIVQLLLHGIGAERTGAEKIDAAKIDVAESTYGQDSAGRAGRPMPALSTRSVGGP